MHACRGWVTKKAKLLELLKAAGNGVVRRGGRKPLPCAGVEAEKELAHDVVPADGVPKVAAVVVGSRGAESVRGMLFKPLPYGWYSKRVSKKAIEGNACSLGKKGCFAPECRHCPNA